MLAILGIATLLFTGCGQEDPGSVHIIRGLAVSYAPGITPYKRSEVDFALQGMEMAYWIPTSWEGLGARIDDAPDCLADGTLLHGLAHKLRERNAGDADWSHMDLRYFGDAGILAKEYNGALVQRATAWYALQFCPTFWRYRPE